jgi:hypothetical protein
LSHIVRISSRAVGTLLTCNPGPNYEELRVARACIRASGINHPAAEINTFLDFVEKDFLEVVVGGAPADVEATDEGWRLGLTADGDCQMHILAKGGLIDLAGLREVVERSGTHKNVVSFTTKIEKRQKLRRKGKSLLFGLLKTS